MEEEIGESSGELDCMAQVFLGSIAVWCGVACSWIYTQFRPYCMHYPIWNLELDLNFHLPFIRI